MDRLELTKPRRNAVLTLLGRGWPGKGDYLKCERYDLGVCAGPKYVILNVCFDDDDRYLRAVISYH